jgi:hypothetical protein
MFVLHIVGAHYDRRKEECGLCDGVCSSLTGCCKCLLAEEEEDRRDREEAEEAAINDSDCCLCGGRGETVEYKKEEWTAGPREVMVVLCADCAAHKETRRSVWVGAYTAYPLEGDETEFMCPDKTWEGMQEKSEVKAFVEKALASAKTEGYLWAHVVVVSWQGRVDEFYRNL